ncbi:hypothetical protein FRC12_021019, partial [Ceratobasidium sp. 428]
MPRQRQRQPTQTKAAIDHPPGRIVTGDLRTFRELHERLADQDGKKPDEFGLHSKLTMTGQYEEGEEPMRLNILPQGPVSRARLQEMWDVDSVIGFIHEGDQFPLEVGTTLFYHPLNNTEFTLEASLHLPKIKLQGEGTLDRMWRGMEPHLIPNALFGFVPGQSVPRMLVRIMFPGVAETREVGKGIKSNRISQEDMEVFYDRVVKPAVDTAFPREQRDHFPLRWVDERFRVTRQNGSVVMTPYTVLAEHVDALHEQMHIKTRGDRTLKKFRNFFFQFQVQGTKHSTHHRPLQQPYTAEEMTEHMETERTEAFARAVAPLDVGRMNPDHWWVDLGVMYHMGDQGFSLLPKTEQHAWLISEATGLGVGDAVERITVGAGAGYFKDELAQLGSVSGFRLRLKEDRAASPLNVQYMQVYTTDKNLTALKDNGHFAKHVDPGKVVDNLSKVLDNHYSRAISAFEEAGQQELAIDTRIEIRLPLWDITKALPPLARDVLQNSLVTARSKDIWYWKRARLEAVATVVSLVQQGLSKVPPQKINGAMTLLVGSVWMGNATMSRADESPPFKVLADTLCVHEKYHEATRACRPLTAFFMHSIREEPYMRVSSNRVLGVETIAKLCGVTGKGGRSGLLNLLAQAVESDEDESPVVWGQGEEYEGEESRPKRRREEDRPRNRTKRVRIALPLGDSVIGENTEGLPADPVIEQYPSEESDPEEPAEGL